MKIRRRGEITSLLALYYSAEEVLHIIMELDPERMEDNLVSWDSGTNTADNDEKYFPGVGHGNTKSDRSTGHSLILKSSLTPPRYWVNLRIHPLCPI